MDRNSSNFGNLPQGNYSSDSILVKNYGGLSVLFDLARRFVDVVFNPLTKQEASAWKLFIEQKTFGESLQEAAFSQTGYFVCLLIGLLFIIIVPFTGSILCCCRCCCKKCGGRLEQSGKRSRSCYRHCLAATMLILTILMTIPTVFVFLTNEWVKDIVNSGTSKTVAVLDDTTAYAEILPIQINYMTNQYSVVESQARHFIQNFNDSVGQPLQEFIIGIFQSSMNNLEIITKDANNVVGTIKTLEQSLSTLVVGMAVLNSNLTDLKSEMGLTLGNPLCVSDRACFAVYKSIPDKLESHDLDAFELGKLNSSLTRANDSLNDFIGENLERKIQKEIERIPSKIQAQTHDARIDALQALDDTKPFVDNVLEGLPKFKEFKSGIRKSADSFNEAVKFYEQYVNKYTYIGGAVLGCILALIVGSYMIGIFLGTCGSNSKTAPDNRGFVSNCGGIVLMAGVGLSFLFSWLLMGLVIVLFTIGGHGERSGCQSLEGPSYKGLAIVEETIDWDLSKVVGLPYDIKLSLGDVLRSCEKNDSAYRAFKLEHIFNVTEKVGGVLEKLEVFKMKADSAVNQIDFTSISVYSNEHRARFLAAARIDVESGNYYGHLAELNILLAGIDLREYEKFLRESANNFTTTNTSLQETVRGYADRVQQIQSTRVDQLQATANTFHANIDELINASRSVNRTISEIDGDLTTLSGRIRTEGAAEIHKIVESGFHPATAYTDWVTTQIEEYFGACKPLHNAYTSLTSVVCDYFMDTLNGLWFSLGWAVFFLVPSVIIAMKLMKFYRTMEYRTGFEETNGEFY